MYKLVITENISVLICGDYTYVQAHISIRYAHRNFQKSNLNSLITNRLCIH